MIIKYEVNPQLTLVAEALAEETKEEVATWPSEPYRLDWDTINWN